MQIKNSWLFKDSKEHTRRIGRPGAFTTKSPISRQSDFRAIYDEEEKTTLPKALSHVAKLFYVTKLYPHPRWIILNPLPLKRADLSYAEHIFKDRLTHVQFLFTWSPPPLRSSKFVFEYLLLPPRSAPGAVSPRLTAQASSQAPKPSYSLMHHGCSNG